MNAAPPTNTPTAVSSAGRSLESLRRVRVGVSLVLTLGVAASIVANVLHAQPTLVGRAIAAWPPLALLLTVELISRVPVHSRRLAALRLTATAGIAGIAAWVSYWHMVEVAHAHGETADSAHLIPLSVDGLVVVASICLVEIGARLRVLSPSAVTTPARPDQQGERPDGDRHDPDRSGEEQEIVPCDVDGRKGPLGDPAKQGQPDPHSAGRSEEVARESQHQGHARVTGTARAVARLRRRYPDWSTAQIAARLNVHPSTVRRHLKAGVSTPTHRDPHPDLRATAPTDASTGTSAIVRQVRAADDTEAA
jgi:hypothetical protein